MADSEYESAGTEPEHELVHLDQLQRQDPVRHMWSPCAQYSVNVRGNGDRLALREVPPPGQARPGGARLPSARMELRRSVNSVERTAMLGLRLVFTIQLNSAPAELAVFGVTRSSYARPCLLDAAHAQGTPAAPGSAVRCVRLDRRSIHYIVIDASASNTVYFS